MISPRFLQFLAWFRENMPKPSNKAIQKWSNKLIQKWFKSHLKVISPKFLQLLAWFGENLPKPSNKVIQTWFKSDLKVIFLGFCNFWLGLGKQVKTIK